MSFGALSQGDEKGRGAVEGGGGCGGSDGENRAV